jgi:hypothetical protein
MKIVSGLGLGSIKLAKHTIDLSKQHRKGCNGSITTILMVRTLDSPVATLIFLHKPSIAGKDAMSPKNWKRWRIVLANLNTYAKLQHHLN